MLLTGALNVLLNDYPTAENSLSPTNVLSSPVCSSAALKKQKITADETFRCETVTFPKVSKQKCLFFYFQ